MNLEPMEIFEEKDEDKRDKMFNVLVSSQYGPQIIGYQVRAELIKRVRAKWEDIQISVAPHCELVYCVNFEVYQAIVEDEIGKMRTYLKTKGINSWI